MKYLPEKFKTRKVRKRSCYTPCSRRRPKRREEPKEIVELLTPPQKVGVLKIKKYANTHFVKVIAEETLLHPAGEDGGEAWNNAGSTHQQHAPQKAEGTGRKIREGEK
jgi:hypothetical protein